MSELAKAATYPHIVRKPGTSGGQPVVEGTRIPVATIARAHRAGMDFDEILVQYPGLTPEKLHAALLYYLDHRGEIDVLIEAADEAPANATTVES